MEPAYGAPSAGNGHHLPPAYDAPPPPPPRSVVRIYPYGIGQNRLRAAANSLNVPIQIAETIQGADAVMTIKNYYRQQPAPILDAERRNIPIYILRSNTVTQMEQCLVDIFHIPSNPMDAFEEAMRETQNGIQQVLNGGADDLELSPRPQPSAASSINSCGPPT